MKGTLKGSKPEEKCRLRIVPCKSDTTWQFPTNARESISLLISRVHSLLVAGVNTRTKLTFMFTMGSKPIESDFKTLISGTDYKSVTYKCFA